MQPVYIYTRLPMTLKSLQVLQLLLEDGFKLEDLAEDINLLINEGTLSPLYQEVITMDYLTLLEMSDSEADPITIVDELRQLTRFIKYNYRKIETLGFRKIHAIHLEYPDIAIFECRPFKQPVQIRQRHGQTHHRHRSRIVPI